MEKVSVTRNSRMIEFGDGDIKICLPIVGRTKQEIAEQCLKAVSYQPDVIEFRADWYEALEQQECLLEVLRQIRDIVNDTILLFTIRTAKEGGEKAISWEQYVTINLAAAQSGYVDLIDVEAFFNCEAMRLDGMPAAELAEYVDEEVVTLLSNLQEKQVKVITSNHDFSKTPSREHMCARMKSMQKMGTDIAKLAVMPQQPEDVLELLNATLEVSKSNQTPVITMSMGAQGMMSRICGTLFGNSMTFACAGKASAPGQIPIEELRKILLLENF